MSSSHPSLSVVIPAFNEAENLRTVLDETKEVCEQLTSDYEIIVVDDKSADGTAAIVEGRAHDDPRIRLIRNATRLGCHPSELRGLCIASKEILVFIPADLQIRPAAIAALVRAAPGYDMVIGVRRDRKDNAVRRLIAYLYARVIRLAFGITLEDLDSATLYRRSLFTEIAPQIDPAQPFIPIEIALRAMRSGKRIRQIEVDHFPRPAGTPAAITLRFMLSLPFKFLRFALRCWTLRIS